MALSAFYDKTKQPTESDLAKRLGKTFVHWNNLKNLIAANFSPLSPEWGFASKSTGWGLRLRHKERIILYMTPCEGYFLASFALGEKAVRAAHEAGLSDFVLSTIDNAKKYAEGRGVRFEVRNAKDVKEVGKVAAIKMAN